MRAGRRGMLRLATLAAAALLAGCQSAVLAWVNRDARAPDQTVTFSSSRALALDVYSPEGGDVHDAVVVFFYGGSWQQGSRRQYRFVGERLASAGMVAVVPDYRTYPSAVFPQFMDDAAAAVAWALDHARELGTRRVIVMGHSAGAQIAALLATDPRYLHAYGHDACALTGAVTLSGPYRFGFTGELANVFPDVSQRASAQPLLQVHRRSPAFLLIHAEHDRVVGIGQAHAYRDALVAQGIRTDWVSLPTGGHVAPLAALYDPSRAPDVLQQITRFARQAQGCEPGASNSQSGHGNRTKADLLL